MSNKNQIQNSQVGIGRDGKFGDKTKNITNTGTNTIYNYINYFPYATFFVIAILLLSIFIIYQNTTSGITPQITNLPIIDSRSQEQRNLPEGTFLISNPVPETPAGEVLDTQYFEATDFCFIDYDTYTEKEHATHMAKECAILYAQAKLIEVIIGRSITKTTNAVIRKKYEDKVNRAISGIIKGQEDILEIKVQSNKVIVKIRVERKMVYSQF